MGGRAGGGGAGLGSRSGGGATERGMSRAMAQGLVNAENGIRGNNFETLYTFDDKGNIVYSEKGGKNSVRYYGHKTVDAVVTHNHPNGSAFSGADLKNAVKFNQKEIRATGKEFTFSMKRPAGGWGKSPLAVARKFNQYHKEASSQYHKLKTGDAALDRKLWIKLSTNASSKLAHDFGWNFTVKKHK